MSSPVDKNHPCSIVTVTEGDTLSAIAAECGETTTDVLAANPQLAHSSADQPRTAGGDLIYPGDTVVMPSFARDLHEMINNIYPNKIEIPKIKELNIPPHGEYLKTL